jgi:ribosomal-protein-serine acetyltransferase
MSKPIELPHPESRYWELAVDDEVSLRQLDVNDADALFQITDGNRDYLSKWLPWVENTTSATDSKLFIETMLLRRLNGEEYGYGIEYDGALVGHISLMHVKDSQDPEIGYWVSSAASGRGVTTKAAARMSQFGCETLGLKKIIIRAKPDNIGSNTVAEKIGYTHVDTIPSDEGEPYNIWQLTA